MMYIEHTPLEDNLQYILKNHVAASDSSSILAHVRDVEEAAGTQLQSQAQVGVSNVAYADYTRRLDVPRQGGSAKATGSVKGDEQQIKSYSARKKSSPGATKRTAGLPAKLNGIGNTKFEVGDEEENYELIDIVDEVEEKVGKDIEITKDFLAKGFAEERPHLTDEIRVQIEDDESNYEYFLHPAPKEQIHNRTNILNIAFENRLHSNSGSLQPRKRPLRPVPAAIPIKRWQSEYELPPLELRPQFPSRGRVLNGFLPLQRCNSTESVASSYHWVEDGHNSVTVYEEPVEEEEETDYDDQNYLPEIVPGRARNSQMGIDIFNKLRRLLNTNSDSKGETRESESRKRSGNWTEEVNPHQIKYKKVHNRFPKIITRTLDDEEFDVISTFPKHEKQMLSCKSPSASKQLLDMTQRKSLNSIEKPKYRKSMFTAPTVTHRLVKNTSYADVEFSDDDEPQLVQGFGLPAANIKTQTNRKAVEKKPHFFNIPIMHERENVRAPASKPPPPLIEPRTGSILATSLMPDTDLRKRNPMSYSEALRQNLQMPNNSGRALGRRSASSLSSSGATSASMGGLNILGNIRPNMWSTNARSILTQEKETEEHVKYQQLLEQVVPCLYGSTSDANARSVMKPPFSFNAQQGRSTSNNRNSNQKALQKNTFGLQNNYSPALKRPPLSSTINLDNDEDEDNDDVTFVSLEPQKSVRSGMPTVIIDDDDEISEIIDLDDEERQVVSACSKLQGQRSDSLASKKNILRLPYVDPVNTLQERFNTSPHLQDNWLAALELKWTERKKTRQQEVNDTVNVAEKLTAERRAAELEMQERVRKMQIIDPELLVIDDFPEPEIDEEPEFVELTPQHQSRIKDAICGPPDQVLVSKFNLNITRRDLHTLLGHNWLNDEVINFYMNLLTERGETRHESEGLPTVYAMNTFFVPRLLSAGHSGVKRWTRKVDIFSKDIIPVPVHVGGVHWCMAIIHLKNRTIKYYDSMGTPNPSVLKALEKYLKDESLDKRKQPFDTSNFEIESVRDVPRQMNGSDCGVFSCMFAEYITRKREITFTQQHMEYFRHKMILEIVRGELLQ